MAYSDRTERLVRRLRADLEHVTDQQVRDLTEAWVTAWNEVQPDLSSTLLDMLTAGDRVTRAQLIRSERLRQVLLVIRSRLEELADGAGVRIVGDLGRVIDMLGGAQASVLDSQLPAEGRHLVDMQAWSKIDPAGLDAIVRRSTEQITSRLKPLAADADRALRAELIRGYAAGSNPRATAGRILAHAEGNFNGGLTRAMAIARTETLDAARAGGHIGRMANADVLAGWYWHCEFSRRSCQACIAMDGTVFPIDAPGPNDHVNGRCTAVPVTKTWAELGLDIPEPESNRQTGREWFTGQPAAVQREILGPTKYDAWRRGDYPFDAWAEFRHNDGWRDSLQATRAPAAAGQSGGRAAS